MSRGSAIFITGVPSSGKTAAANELAHRLPDFNVLSGDQTIREFNKEAPGSARHLFYRLLDRVDAMLSAGDVVVDMTLPESYVREARTRFGEDAVFVGLRLPESERVRREQLRTDRTPVAWNPYLSSLHGPDALYDLNLDSSEHSAKKIADEIASFVHKRWPSSDRG